METTRPKPLRQILFNMSTGTAGEAELIPVLALPAASLSRLNRVHCPELNTKDGIAFVVFEKFVHLFNVV